MQASDRSFARSDSQWTQGAQRNTKCEEKKDRGSGLCKRDCKAPASKGDRYKTTENRISAARDGGG